MLPTPCIINGGGFGGDIAFIGVNARPNIRLGK
jgi:hypothetical protein